MSCAINLTSDTGSQTVAELCLPLDDLLRALLSLSPHRHLSILDSCGANGAAARFLIAGFDPFEIIETRGQRVSIKRRGELTTGILKTDALDLLDERLRAYQVSPVPTEGIPVAGACIATFSYDLVPQLERLRVGKRWPASVEPDLFLAFYDTLIIHDYQTARTRIVTLKDRGRAAETEQGLCEALEHSAPESDSRPPAIESVRSNLTRDQYLATVRQIKEHIAAGDIYQANLTQRLSCRLDPQASPESIYQRLRRKHPAPFAAFIRRLDDLIISASPERFLHVVRRSSGERVVEAWPIKGTRPRGATVEEDLRLRHELLTSEKDRAENVMIVDLLRNDLGRVCRYGSIEVADVCALEEHSTLFHLASKVRGLLRDEVTAGALMRAAFPCGSITGAPKIRAIEIIAELETAARGLSMGALGYFSFDGRLDLNVAIRTMVLREGKAQFNVGGGIVADSCPAHEYEESLVKARALLSALGVTRPLDVSALLC